MRAREWPDEVPVAKYSMSKVKVKHAFGGFLHGGITVNGAAKQRLTADYFREAAEDKSHSKWSKVKDLIQMIKKHESWLRSVIKKGRSVDFGYAIDEFDHSAGSLVHVSALKNILTEAKRLKYVTEYDGITTAWTYFSAIGGLFGFHEEDSNLMSFNANLKGSRKIWLFVVPEDLRIVKTNAERIMREMKYEDDDEEGKLKSQCADMLRHKEFYFPAKFLNRIGAKYYYLDQNEGEAVITLPGCGHQGFNTGSGMHVAVNMLSEWAIPFSMASTHVSYISTLILVPVS
jgi:hypothetical protein